MTIQILCYMLLLNVLKYHVFTKNITYYKRFFKNNFLSYTIELKIEITPTFKKHNLA